MRRPPLPFCGCRGILSGIFTHFLMKPGKNQPYKIIIAAFAGLGVVLAAGAVGLGFLGRGGSHAAPSAAGPEKSLQALSEALDRRDSAAAMTYIDFDALLTDINRTDIAYTMHLKIDDPKVEQVLKTAMPDNVMRTMRGGFVSQLKAADLDKSEPGSLLAGLMALRGAQVVRTGADTAYVELPLGRKLMLAAAADQGIWRVVGYRGYEADMERYQKASGQQIVNTLAPSKAADAAAGPAPKKP